MRSGHTRWMGAVAVVLLVPWAALEAQATRPRELSEAVVPFTIRVSDSVLSDLRPRLSRARFADEIPDVGWDYGTNLAYLKELVAYWRDRYDWRAQEKRLNQFFQFTTRIDGIDVHFIHQRSTSPTATPLLLLNGWPSSIVEYAKVIGPLTNPAAPGGRSEDSFHVVIPSMPGFGFSGKPRERGYHPERIARMWMTLMARLGYTRYGVHGSDWGGNVGTRVALNDAAHVTALHLAGCGAAPAAGSPPPAPIVNAAIDEAHNLGYRELQSTRPQTIGHALSDSPVALASWITEKWYSWAGHQGDLERVVTKDELLTNVMIYWVTDSGASSARLYYESRHMNGDLAPTPFPQARGKVGAPTGCAIFPSRYDRRSAPAVSVTEGRKAAEVRYNVVHFVTLQDGGHFPALDAPTTWVSEIRTFFRDKR